MFTVNSRYVNSRYVNSRYVNSRYVNSRYVNTEQLLLLGGQMEQIRNNHRSKNSNYKNYVVKNYHIPTMFD